MGTLEEHHSLALMLLVGRSLPDGLPWSYEEDREHLVRERALWASLTEEEQRSEQDFLAGLWASPDRKVRADPSWGPWASDAGDVVLLDGAFGGPRRDYRPYPKGPPVEDHGGYARVFRWLEERGFHVVDVDVQGWVLMPIPERRVTNEANRLLGLITASFPHVVVRPASYRILGVQVRAVYDPVCGLAFLELFGLDDFIAFG